MVKISMAAMLIPANCSHNPVDVWLVMRATTKPPTSRPAVSIAVARGVDRRRYSDHAFHAKIPTPAGARAVATLAGRLATGREGSNSVMRRRPSLPVRSIRAIESA